METRRKRCEMRELKQGIEERERGRRRGKGREREKGNKFQTGLLKNPRLNGSCGGRERSDEVSDVVRCVIRGVLWGVRVGGCLRPLPQHVQVPLSKREHQLVRPIPLPVTHCTIQHPPIRRVE
jgi:hypothetical protein